MIIDIERLRQDLKNNYLGLFYGGGFGGALITSFQIDNLTEEELINLAIKSGIDITNYIIKERGR